MTESASTRPCGWLPDPDLTHGAIGQSVAAAGVDFDAIDLPDTGGVPRPEWDPRQIGQSCTGHTLAEQGYGLTGIKYSPYHSYHWGLVHDIGPNESDLVDAGVSVSSVLASGREHGLALWDKWNPASPGFSVLNRPPALARISAQRANLDLVRIFASGGEAASESVCTALYRGWPVGVVVKVDESFDAAGEDGVVGPERGRVRGMHMITAWSYTTTMDGYRSVRCLCHWGPGFGHRGGVYLHPSRIRSSPYLCYARGVS